jgi:transglutaminase superfamily protein
MANSSTHAVHSPYSDPGRHAELLRALPGTAAAISAAARNVIAHYRAELPDLPEERQHEVDSRWLEVILSVDQERHGTPLTAARPLADRVAGCCRDHTLFVVGGLREHGVPARSRVGFAGYFTPGYHHDHVIVEYLDGNRWRRIDPELTPGRSDFDPEDMAAGPDAPFQTAAEVWQGYRAGELDPETYGVFPGAPFAGPDFIRGYVIFQVAHRFGDELLLWDEWGATLGSGHEALVDRVADLLVRADAGDSDAEEELYAWYRADDRLHPGDSVIQNSPYGGPPRSVSLRRETTRRPDR